MRLAFFDGIPWDYRADSAYCTALGGSQSAVCFLTEELASLGHEVFLLTHTSAPGLCQGVHCLSLDQSQEVEWLQSLNAIIVLNAAGEGRLLRNTLANVSAVRAKLILWMQNGAEQPATRSLADPSEQSAWDKIVVISDWQREEFRTHFAVGFEQMAVLRNAIGAPFRGLFPPETNIASAKTRPFALAYTSTPFRGLDVLLEVFPRIRDAVPETTLKVFSSMNVYQVPKAEDEAQYGDLYRRCRALDGVEYIGSVPQPVLAEALKRVSVLAYPNIFPETGCIAAMEAMAAGCWIVTSALGALPETTAGFAKLLPIRAEKLEKYKKDFADTTIALLRDLDSKDAASENHLRRQVTYMNNHVTWAVRAKEWTEWLKTIC
jgi:glycosyltransferase involved in cell wall biosynthesis